MRHDDGHLPEDLTVADVILVGVSRTSKTPTCIYLANRGIKAANVPFVPNHPIPEPLLQAKHTLIVGLVTNPDRLVQIRRSRLLGQNEESETDYVDLDAVKQEVAESRKLFGRHDWQVIDVTRRSMEETSAAILTLYQHTKHDYTLRLADGDLFGSFGADVRPDGPIDALERL